jgi:hypothetical protein
MLIRPLAILILLSLSAVNIYRAKTQSITCDEALSYELWGAPPLPHMWESYDASNHVLQTLLSKVSVAAFGLSEFTLRLPTLLGGFLYFIAIYRLSSLVFGQAGLFLLSVCVLSLNPLLLDLLSAARGYGLALAFCAWALFYMVSYMVSRRPQGPAQTPYRMLKLALLLALSVSSNITFLFIDAGLAVLFVMALLLDCQDRKEMGRKALQTVAYFIIPGVVLTLVILSGPLRNARRADFYFGWPSLAGSGRSLVYMSFVHHITLTGIRHYYDVLDGFVTFTSTWFVPVILCLAGLVWLAAVISAVRNQAFLEQLQDRFLFFCAGALLFSIAASFVAHQAEGLLYPLSRTGLPWIVFFLLTCLGLVKKFQAGSIALRIIRWPVLSFVVACALWFAFEFNTNQYREWDYDAGSKRIVALLRTGHQAEPGKTWQVGVTWALLPSMNFYKSLYHLDWFQPVDTRNGTDQLTHFVLVQKDLQLLQTLGLHTTYADPVSSQVLATR